MKDKVLVGKKFTGAYKGHNLYNTITPESFDISIVSNVKDPEQTMLEGLEIMAVLATMALENGADIEEMSGRIWECSRNKGSLGDTLSMNLARFADASS